MSLNWFHKGFSSNGNGSQCLRPPAAVWGAYEACRGYLAQLRRKSSLKSFSTLNERDKFLLRAPRSSRTRGREFTTAIKISLKLFMGNAYALLSLWEKKAANLLLCMRTISWKRRASNGTSNVWIKQWLSLILQS